jgi:opacity protein-like surface antigen
MAGAFCFRAKRIVSTVLVLLAALSSSAIAAESHGGMGPGSMAVGGGFGQVLLLGDFGGNFSDSLGYHLNFDYEASQMFGLLVTLGMSNHDNADSTNSLGIKSLTPDLKVNLAYIDKLTLYTLLGFGIYRVSETIGKTSGSVTTVGFNMGGGFNLALSEHFLFGTEVDFTSVFSKTDSTPGQPALKIGGTTLGLFLNVGYIF